MCCLITMILLAIATFDAAVSDPNYDNTDALVYYILSVGIFFNPRQNIHNKVPVNPASFCGVFSDSDIASGYLLVDITCKETLIYGNEGAGGYTDKCILTWDLCRDLEKGCGSKSAPYVSLLLQQDMGIPNYWYGEGL